MRSLLEILLIQGPETGDLCPALGTRRLGSRSLQIGQVGNGLDEADAGLDELPDLTVDERMARMELLMADLAGEVKKIASGKPQPKKAAPKTSR